MGRLRMGAELTSGWDSLGLYGRRTESGVVLGLGSMMAGTGVLGELSDLGESIIALPDLDLDGFASGNEGTCED